MADSSGYVQAIARLEAGEHDATSKMSLETLMDRLRTRRNHHCRSWTETTKALRMFITDKRHQSEVLEKSLLYRHLDTLQKAFKVNSLPLMIDRLESISKHIGLKFTHGHSGTDIFISSDMFYVEILLEPMTGIVKDVKIAHNADAVSCPEIKDALREGRFDECSEHIEGLSSIYQINGDKKQRTKCYLALTSLETDLNMLSKLQSTISSVANYIHKSPLGILQPRIGGQPMKMIYFVGPYNLLNDKLKTACPMTMEAIIENKVGFSVTVGIEQSTPHKLQTIPLMTINKTHDGKSLPSFSGMSSHNCCSLSAVFVLKLQQPIPMALSIIHKIQQTTGIEFIDRSSLRPLTSLIIQDTCQGKLKEHKYEKGHFVTLPDQQHCYFMSGVNGSGDMMGAMVTKIPFTHPTSVPSVIVFLRQQVLFNTVISSCLRPSPKEEMETSLTFEVTPVSLQNVTVTFEHPFKESMATADVDMSDITSVKCKMVICNGEEAICTDDFSTKVIQRCLSVPVTLRSILRSVTNQIDKEVYSRPSEPNPPPYCMSRIGQERRQAFIDAHQLGSRDQGYTGIHKDLLSGGSSQSSLNHGPPAPPPYDFQRGNLTIHDQAVVDPRMPNIVMDKVKTDKVAKNPMLASLLDQDTGSPDPPVPPPQQNSMLSALLADTHSAQSLHPPMSVAGTMPLMSPFHQPQFNQQPQPQTKQKRPRKRKSLTDRSPAGRSPKRKASEDDFQQPSSVDTERSNTTSPFDVAPGGHHAFSFPSSHMEEPYNQHESLVSKLANKMENFIKQETPPLPSFQKSELESMLNESDGKDLRALSRSSSVELNIKMEDVKSEHVHVSPPYTNDSVFTSPPNTGESVNHDVFSKEFQSHCKPPCISKRTSVSSGGRDSSVKTHNHDPFDFASAASADIPSKCLDPETVNPDNCDKPLSGSGSSSLKIHTIALLNKSNHEKELKADNKSEEFTRNVKSEKRREKKEGKDSSRDDDRGHEKEKPLAITVKLNTKDLTAKTILHESPHHRSESPVEAMDLSSWKEKKERGLSKLSMSDGAIDLTGLDSEVDKMTRATSGPSTSASVSTRIPSGPNKKNESKEKTKSEKKRKSSKHVTSNDGVSEKKRRREDVKREQLKKQKIYDFDSEIDESENYRVDKTQQIMKPTTIKITKMQVQGGPKIVKSASRSSSTTGSVKGKSHVSEKSASPKHRSLNNPRNYSRSKSDSAQIVSKGEGKMDTKLIKTPTIKLEPLNMSSGSATVTITSSGTKTSQSVRSVQASRQAPSNPPSRESSKQVKAAPIKSRKNSLSAVIDKLVSKQHSGGTGSGMGDSKDLEKGAAAAKKDKSIYDEIRLAIVREGNKPSTPTKEVATLKSSQSLKTGTIPKTGLSQSFNMKATSGGSATSKLNNSQLPTIPKANNVSSNMFSDSKGDANKTRDLTPRMSLASSRADQKADGASKNNAISNSQTNDSISKFDSSSMHNNKVEDIKEIKEPPRLLNTAPAPPPKVIPLQKQGESERIEKPQPVAKVTPSTTHKMSPMPKEDATNERLPSRHFLDVVTKLNGSSSSSSGAPNSSCAPNNQGVRHTVPKADSNSENRKFMSNPSKSGAHECANQARPDGPMSLSSSSTPKPGPVRNSDGKSDMAGGVGDRGSSRRGPSPVVDGSRLRPDPSIESKEHHNSRGSSQTERRVSLEGKTLIRPDVPGGGHGKPSSGEPSDYGINGPDSLSSPTPHTSIRVSSLAQPGNKNSEDKENTNVDQSSDDVFKSPTPKGMRSEEHEKRNDSRERSRSKPVLSPRSDISSPEDGLIIDCPGTPGRSSRSPAVSKSHEANSPAPKSPCFLHSPMDNTPTRSPSHPVPRSPSPRKPSKSSPLPSQSAKSPAVVRSNTGSSPASCNAASPCEIDDDLMNEAIIL